MALFTLADLHLSFSGTKPMDIFGPLWSDFEERIRKNWIAAIKEEDTIVLPGDFSWGMNLTEALPDFQFLHDLPGKKILMKGNHDYWWSSVTKLNAFCEKEGFHSISFLHNDAVVAQGKVLCGSRGWMCEEKMTEQDQKVLRREAMRFRLSLEKGMLLAQQERDKNGTLPEIIVFSHYPIVTAAQRQNPILDILEEYPVKRVYYGHLHNIGTKPLFDRHGDLALTLVSADHLRFIPLEIK